MSMATMAKRMTKRMKKTLCMSRKQEAAVKVKMKSLHTCRWCPMSYPREAPKHLTSPVPNK